MMRTWVRAAALSLGLVALAAPASAQVVQSVSFGFGYTWARSFDSRVPGDVLVADLTQPIIPGTVPPATGSLLFAISDFNGWPVMGEWHLAFGNHVELGVGASYQNRLVHSLYADLVDGHGTIDPNDDTEIRQQLRLKVIPITAVVRVLAGRVGHFQPYAGGGISAMNFKYSETGEFVDTSDLSVFSDQFIAKGTTLGTVLLGGVRMPLKGDVYAINVEGRYQWGHGNTGGINNGFLDDKIDLSGGALHFTFLIRY